MLTINYILHFDLAVKLNRNMNILEVQYINIIVCTQILSNIQS